jgi:hypothetical protein
VLAWLEPGPRDALVLLHRWSPSLGTSYAAASGTRTQTGCNWGAWLRSNQATNQPQKLQVLCV